PDEPEARFSILRADVATELAAARQRGEGHLVVGVLLQSGGAVDDARREFQALVDANPDSAVAHGLLESTQRRETSESLPSLECSAGFSDSRAFAQPNSRKT